MLSNHLQCRTENMKTRIQADKIMGIIREDISVRHLCKLGDALVQKIQRFEDALLLLKLAESKAAKGNKTLQSNIQELLGNQMK